MKKLLLLVLFWILGTYIASATHLRAGEITYKLINSLTYEVTLTTYTDISMGNADDMGANLDFGDGTNSDATRSNGPGNMGEIFNNTTYKKNIYVFNHSYATAGKYTISFTKENRNAGVLNMDQSVQTPFYVETFLIINPFIDFNSSPRLMQPPIDFGGLNKLFVHNPGADDPDGDSLSYELVACRKGVGIEVDNYRFPTPNNGFATQSFTIDSIRGDVIWRNPNTIGLFNIAILITEWRYLPAQNRYIKIGSVVRDMQIEIKDTRNNPPVLQLPNDTCVLAGTFLNTVITATDADSDEITMTATSRIFSLPSPNTGVFNQPSQGIGFVTEPFSWATSCNQV